MAKFAEIAKEELEELYKWHSTAGIAARYGVNPETVRQRLVKFGIARRKKGGRRDFDPPAKDLAELYQSMSMAQIAQKFSVGETVVWERLHEHGIELRDFKNHRLKPGRIFSQEHRKNLSQSMRGKVGPLNRNWKGGKATKIFNCVDRLNIANGKDRHLIFAATNAKNAVEKMDGNVTAAAFALSSMFIMSCLSQKCRNGDLIQLTAKYFALNATTEGIEANRVNCWKVLRAQTPQRSW